MSEELLVLQHHSLKSPRNSPGRERVCSSGFQGPSKSVPQTQEKVTNGTSRCVHNSFFV